MIHAIVLEGMSILENKVEMLLMAHQNVQGQYIYDLLQKVMCLFVSITMNSNCILGISNKYFTIETISNQEEVLATTLSS